MGDAERTSFGTAIPERLRLGVLTGALLALLLAGCASGGGQSDPTASPSPVGEPLSATQVTTSLMPQRVAEQMGVNWDELRSAAGALQWQLVDAAEVRMAAAGTGSGSPTVASLSGFTSAAADS